MCTFLVLKTNNAKPIPQLKQAFVSTMFGFPLLVFYDQFSEQPQQDVYETDLFPHKDTIVLLDYVNTKLI